MAKHLPAAQHHFRPRAEPAAYSSASLPAIGYRSSGWLPNDAPFLPEPASCTGWPAPSRLTQEKCMLMRISAASDAASPPSTAVNVPHRARVPLAAVDALCRQVLRPPYWSRPKPRSGRSSAALVRRIACGGCAARLPPDGCSTPVRVRRGTRRGGSGRVQADARAREGPLTPSPGLGLLPTVQLAGPMPRDMPLSRIRGYNEALCAKVNVRAPARRRTSQNALQCTRLLYTAQPDLHTVPTT